MSVGLTTTLVWALLDFILAESNHLLHSIVDVVNQVEFHSRLSLFFVILWLLDLIAILLLGGLIHNGVGDLELLCVELKL